MEKKSLMCILRSSVRILPVQFVWKNTSVWLQAVEMFMFDTYDECGGRTNRHKQALLLKARLRTWLLLRNRSQWTRSRPVDRCRLCRNVQAAASPEIQQLLLTVHDVIVTKILTVGTFLYRCGLHGTSKKTYKLLWL